MTRRSKLALVIAVAVVVITGFVLTAMYMSWQMLDPPIVPGLAIIIPATLGLAIWVARKARGWKRRVGSALGVTWIGVFTFAFVLFGFTGACNAWLDSSEPAWHRVKVLEKYNKRSGKRFVEVESWRTPGEREGLWIPSEAVDATDLLNIQVRSGFFGFTWISAIEPTT